MFRVKPRATLGLIFFTVLIQKSEKQRKVFSGCLKNLPSGIPSGHVLFPVWLKALLLFLSSEKVARGWKSLFRETSASQFCCGVFRFGSDVILVILRMFDQMGAGAGVKQANVFLVWWVHFQDCRNWGRFLTSRGWNLTRNLGSTCCTCKVPIVSNFYRMLCRVVKNITFLACGIMP